MRRISVLILGLSVLAVGCGSTSPTAPSSGNGTGTRTTSTFTVPLSPANEVPAVTNADASASGTATIALTVTRNDAGEVTAATANIDISVTGFPAGTVITDAHLHSGPAGVSGGVLVSAGLGSGELALVNGSGSVTKSNINVPTERVSAILNNPAGYYFNVHTALNPDGAIRGQLAGGEATFDPGTPSPY